MLARPLTALFLHKRFFWPEVLHISMHSVHKLIYWGKHYVVFLLTNDLILIFVNEIPTQRATCRVFNAHERKPAATRGCQHSAMLRAEPAAAAPMIHPPAAARHTCSAAQLLAIVALALVLTAFLVALLPGAAYQSSLNGTPCAGGSVPCWREHSGTGAADSLPPPPPPPPPAPAAPRPLELIIISDWHTHPDYSPSVRPDYPCFCSNASSDKSTTDNVPCARAQPASNYGQVGCDSPELLTSASLEAAAADIPQPDLVIVLGDLVWHESTGQASTQEIFHHVSRVIAQAFPGRPRACTVPLGNNDVYPGYHVNNSNPREYAWQVTLTLVRARARARVRVRVRVRVK